MLDWLKKKKAHFDSMQLNTDAKIIIDQAFQSFHADSLNLIAKYVRGQLEKSQHHFGKSNIDLKRAIFESKRFHKEAIRANDQKKITAMTLVIIYLKSEMIGAGCEPAIGRIQNFLNDFENLK